MTPTQVQARQRHRLQQVLLLVNGAGFTAIEFDSAPSDPVPQDVVLAIARKEDAAIKSGPPALKPQSR
jgi:hypothetical protein